MAEGTEEHGMNVSVIERKREGGAVYLRGGPVDFLGVGGGTTNPPVNHFQPTINKTRI